MKGTPWATVRSVMQVSQHNAEHSGWRSRDLVA